LLPNGTCFLDTLEYMHSSPASIQKGELQSEQRLLAFVVHPGKEPVLVQVGPSAPIHEAIAAWRKAIADEEDVDTLGMRLRELLWKPLEAELVGARQLFISPDGPLAQLPLGALPGKQVGSYLLEDQSFSYVASAQDLLRALHTDKSPGGSAGGLLALGDIDYQQVPDRVPPADTVVALRSIDVGSRSRAGFSPLPGTGVEVEHGRSIFQEAFMGEPADVLTGTEAHETRVMQELENGRQFVHFATHGFFESPERLRRMLRAPQQAVAEFSPTAQPSEREASVATLAPLLKSGLALTGAAAERPPLTAEQVTSGAIPDDGILTAEDVASLDMRGTELVTLSACDTGLGELTAGQGVMGLQRAFHRAGVETVVSSLWKVDDAATTVLMEEFYTNLWLKKMPKLEALRQAQITLLNHPERIEVQREKLEAELASRGLSGQVKQLPGGGKRAAPAGDVPQRSHPADWAAFVLSGNPE
jgi:CHAT domain-containing protein